MMRLFTRITAAMIALALATASYGQFEIIRKTGHWGKIETMDLSNGGKYFLTLDERNKCLVWDIKEREQVNVINDVYNAKFAPDGESIYIATVDKTFKLVDIAGKTIKEFSIHAYKKELDRNRMFYPSDNLFIAENRLFDMNKGFVKNLTFEGWGLGQDYSPAKKLVAVADVDTNRIGFVAIPSGTHKGFIKTDIKEKGHKSILFSPDGNKVLVYSFNKLQVLSVETGAILRSFSVAGSNTGIGFAVFDPAGKDIIWSNISYDKSRIIRSEIATGKIVWQRSFITNNKEEHLFRLYNAIAKMADDGRNLLVADIWTDQLLIDPATGKTVQEFKKVFESHVSTLTVNGRKTELAAVLNKKAVFWNLETGGMEGSTDVEYQDDVRFEKSTTNFFDKSKTGSEDRVKKDRHGKVLKTYSGGYYAIQSSSDQRYECIVQPATETSVAACGNKEKASDILKITDLQTNKVVFTRSCQWNEASIANTQRIVALKETDDPYEIRFYNYLTGQRLFTIRNPHLPLSTNEMYFSPDDAYLVMRARDYGICVFDLANKSSYVIDSTEMGITKNSFHFINGFTPDNKYAIVYHDPGFIKFIDLSTGKVDKAETFKATTQGFQPKIDFSRDANFIFLTGQSGTIQVYDRTQKKMVARLYPFAETGDWAVLTPSGMFDASPGAQNTMYYKSGKNIAPLGTMFEKFYTPKLLPRILSGEPFEPVPDVNKLKTVPVVTVRYMEGERNLTVEDDDARIIETKKNSGTIVVHADCPSDKVTEIRLYQNGKLVESTRNLVVEDAGGQTSMKKTFAVTLTEGGNVFKVVAMNSQRSEGKPVFINTKLVSDKKTNDPATVKTGMQLHLIIVGINVYKNPRYNLNYAQADAAAFKAAIEHGAKGIFSNVNTHFVTDKQATREGIQSALEKVKQNATAEDLVIFYYAGHGVLDDKKEFYLVPHDVTQLYGNDESLAKLGISAALMQQYSKDIRAQKQLFILDACQSAGALNNAVGARGAAEEKAIAQLARSTGTHWLTASGSDQFAAEFSQLGHGSFTYCLLQALKGEADNGDKKLTIKEIDSYLQSKVPEVTQKFKGNPQYPASFGYGNDFPIVIIR